jgi:hypothetical protein
MAFGIWWNLQVGHLPRLIKRNFRLLPIVQLQVCFFFCLVFFHSFDPISQLLELKRAYDNGQILHPYKHLETQRVGTPSQISGLFRDTKKID